MGTTGSSEKIAMNTALPDIIARVRKFANVPLAVGFGVATREHFNAVADAGADGVVIGSRLVTIMKNAPQGQVAKVVENYCREISAADMPALHTTREAPSPAIHESNGSLPAVSSGSEPGVLPARFGQFGGQYVPEALYGCLAELEAAHKSAIDDPEFWKEFESFFGYMNRPSELYLADKLTAHADGAKIWLKREDLYVFVDAICAKLTVTWICFDRNHTGSHKINNAIGQVRDFLAMLFNL
jgi:tryptophan synthase